VVNIVNQSAFSIGGFRHYSGLLPAIYGGGGGVDRASVRVFHIAATNPNALFRGDIAIFADSTHPVQGAGDLPANVGAPSAQLVIGNGGGSLLGNASIAPNITRWTPADTTSTIAGVIVGWGPITLYQAKNGFQFVPINTEAWAFVETDPQIEMYATVPTVPGTAFNQILNGGIDVQNNAPFQATRFGVSGLSLNPATFAVTATLPLRILSSGEQIGNDPTLPGFVAKVTFNKTRHFAGTGAFTLD
jgi:hypothetical protein